MEKKTKGNIIPVSERPNNERPVINTFEDIQKKNDKELEEYLILCGSHFIVPFDNSNEERIKIELVRRELETRATNNYARATIRLSIISTIIAFIALVIAITAIIL